MRQQDEISIRALEEAYDKAWNAGDVGAMAALFVPDAVVVSPMGKRAAGWLEIEHFLGEFLQGPGKGSRHSSVVLGVEFIQEDVALVDGEATLDGLSISLGANASTLIHRFTDVVVKRDGVWLIAQVRAYVLMRPVG